MRRVGDLTSYEDMSIDLPDAAANAAMNEIELAVNSGRNSLGILCAVARALRDHGVTFNVVA